jgi:transposase InsO family protein
MTEDRMSISARYEYLRAMRHAFLRSDRKARALMLEHICIATQLSEKYVVACLRDPYLERQPRTSQRGREYGEDVAQVVATVARELHWPCAERLQPALRETVQCLVAHGELEVTPAVQVKLERISVATVGRILKRVRPAEHPPRAYPGRPPESSAQRAVPVSVIPWDVPEPGHFEMDLVHHGVPDPQGRLLCTLQFVDVLTGWSERFAIMGTGFDAVYDAVKALLRRCPIPIRELHSDNGSEFINQALIAVLGDERLRLTQTRGRPGYHNDNRFVEQKNSSLVRAYFGNMPLHTYEELRALRLLYEDMWVFYNLFAPVMRQTERTAATGKDGIVHIRRTQDVARTPLKRLQEARPPISRPVLARLQTLHDNTNLGELNRHIDAQLADLKTMVSLRYQSAAT